MSNMDLQKKKRMKMTKTVTKLVFTRCNLCDSAKISWRDREDENHLCYECMQSENDRVFEHGDQN